MTLLSAIQATVGEQIGGCMYVQIEVGGKKLQAMVDTGADTVYMAKELIDEIRPSYKRRELMSRKSMQRAYQLMELLMMRTSKFNHEEVRST